MGLEARIQILKCCWGHGGEILMVKALFLNDRPKLCDRPRSGGRFGFHRIQGLGLKPQVAILLHWVQADRRQGIEAEFNCLGAEG